MDQQPLYPIQERLRILEGVVFRDRQRQRRREGETPIQITTSTGESVPVDSDVQDEGRVHREEVGSDVEKAAREGWDLRKRKTAYLVAKALGLETYTDEAEGCSGSFYDCNICLEMARDPVLTCCGHLFCWPCFYRLSYAYSVAKECPVCKGEVTEASIIPIYGSASVDCIDKLGSEGDALIVPDRPHASRIESIRQQCRSPTATPIHEMMISYLLHNLASFEEQFQFETPGATTSRPNDLAAQSRQEAENSQHTSSYQFSTLPLHEDASLSYDLAIDHLDILFREFESFHMRLVSDNRGSPFSIVAISGRPNGDVAATNSATPSFVSPISSEDDFNAVSDTDIHTTNSSTQTISAYPPSSTGTDL